MALRRVDSSILVRERRAYASASKRKEKSTGRRAIFGLVLVIRQRVGPAQLYFHGPSYDSPDALRVRIQYPAVPLIPLIDPKLQTLSEVKPLISQAREMTVDG